MMELIGYDPDAGKGAVQVRVESVLRACGVGDGVLARLAEIGYYSAPASRAHHLSIQGGLAIHSLNVMQRLVKLTGAWGVEWKRPDGPIVVALMHDLVKTACYQEGVIGYDYVQPVYPGHGVASMMIAESIGVQLEEDERLAIVHHMGVHGLSGRPLEEFDAASDSAYGPQILATHMADWFASRVDERDFKVSPF